MTHTNEKILVSISSSELLSNDTLYTLNPDGGDLARLFDFRNHPRHDRGGIWQPRIASGGDAVYFCSDHAYLYTPATRNLFRITADGRHLQQITPGPNSGRWDQPGPYGSVEGRVEKSNGEPWYNAPLYLEGVGMTYSQPDGTFRFEKVPEGSRWIVAYRPGDADVSEAQPLSVVAGTVYGPLLLVPDYPTRMTFEAPIPHGERVYHRFMLTQVQWTDLDSAAYNEVYTVPVAGCISPPLVEGVDVAPGSSRLAIVDYHGDGCSENRGLYLADADGDNVRLLVDMKADYNWSGAQEVFWSPDETRIALKASYNWHTCLLVFDAVSGKVLGWTYYDPSYSLFNVTLHGWSPDGRWLLCSQWLNQPTMGALSKIVVNADGSLDTTAVTTLVANAGISGATWGMIQE